MANSTVQHLSSLEDEGALSLYNSPIRVRSPRGSFEDEGALSLYNSPVRVRSPRGYLEDEEALPLYHSPIRVRSPRGSFEFLPVARSNMCFAEDIFLRGRLLPLAPKEPSKEDLNPQEQKKRLVLYDPRRKSLDGRLLKSKSYGGEDSPAKKKKPKWYVLAFGSISLQPDMELGDMRSRLKKLREQNNGRSLSSGVTWRLIRSLSCRGDVGGVEDRFVA